MFFSKTYLKAFTISFILLMGSLLVGAIKGYKFEGDAEHVVDERNNFYDRATVVSLYLENLKNTWPLVVIPGIGIGIFIRATYNVGWVLGVHALRWRKSPLSVTLRSFIWNFPESSAYLVMLTENIFISYLLCKKRHSRVFKRIRVDTWKSVLLYLCILLIAAFWEYHFVL